MKMKTPSRWWPTARIFLLTLSAIQKPRCSPTDAFILGRYSANVLRADHFSFLQFFKLTDFVV